MNISKFFDTPIGKELIRFSWIYFILALINLRVKLLFTPFWFSGILEKDHTLFLQFQNTNNEQSRILQFYIPEALIKLFGLSIPDAYLIQRWVFIFLTFVFFHIYLRKWFDYKLAFSGVVFLSAVMPLTYFNLLQESAPLLMLTFLLGLWTIREKQIYRYMLILLIGAVNNETILILPSVFFFFNAQKLEIKHLANLLLRTFVTCLPAYAYTGFIRYLTRDRPHLGGAWHLPDNIAGIIRQLSESPLLYWRAHFLSAFFIFGAFWFFAFYRQSGKPLFLKRALWMTPIFVFIHLLTGVIEESRQMLPLSFIIIPSALWVISSEIEKSSN
ncbi:MAG: hypothetical protein HQM13_21505 [SAR324 cluster bacterium]|nr:hypothetical protein [SAR324 cluster bacterium]